MFGHFHFRDILPNSRYKNDKNCIGTVEKYEVDSTTIQTTTTSVKKCKLKDIKTTLKYVRL